jgi:hypothetical protein
LRRCLRKEKGKSDADDSVAAPDFRARKAERALSRDQTFIGSDLPS